MKPLTSFRIKASYRTKYYYEVNLWKTKADMQKHCFWVKLGKDCRGAVSSMKSNKRKYFLGQINLQKKYLGMEVITHESCHAGLFYLQRIKLTQDTNKRTKGNTLNADGFDETLCYSVGFVAAELVRKLRKAKYIL